MQIYGSFKYEFNLTTNVRIHSLIEKFIMVKFLLWKLLLVKYFTVKPSYNTRASLPQCEYMWQIKPLLI